VKETCPKKTSIIHFLLFVEARGKQNKTKGHGRERGTTREMKGEAKGGGRRGNKE
jgi:hypothetical protein